MTEERETLQGREAMALQELADYIEQQNFDPDELDSFLDEPHDTIHEIADGCVPVYTSDLMEMAAGNYNDLATTEPELGPAFDGSSTPVNIIAANVFEAIEAALWENIRERQAEREEAKQTA